MNYAPIVIFTYRRRIDKTIQSLLNNDLSKNHELFIFSDGFKTDIDRQDVIEVRKSLQTITGFKSIKIIKSKTNKGLANSIIDGVTQILEKYKNVIVIEDDLIVSNDFLTYMNGTLNFYEDEKSIWSISGYGPNLPCLNEYTEDLYLSVRASSWGWATWKDRWDTIDWEVKEFNRLAQNKQLQNSFDRGGNDMFKMLELQMLHKIDSWAIRWCFNQFQQNKYTVYPKKSKVINDGFGDNLGAHNNNIHNKKVITLDNSSIKFQKLSPDPKLIQCFKAYHDLSLKTKIGYFLKKHGGYSIIKRVSHFFSRKQPL